jgi:hypothetical protein
MVAELCDLSYEQCLERLAEQGKVLAVTAGCTGTAKSRDVLRAQMTLVSMTLARIDRLATPEPQPRAYA